MNQRSFPRLYMSAETTITTSAGAFTGIVENISLGGMFVRTNQQIVVGDTTDIIISLPSTSITGSIMAKGIAVRSEERGVAFKFYNIDHNTFCDLLSLMDCPSA
jgi:Tfp pilus assembly protein PilZ